MDGNCAFVIQCNQVLEGDRDGDLEADALVEHLLDYCRKISDSVVEVFSLEDPIAVKMYLLALKTDSSVINFRRIDIGGGEELVRKKIAEAFSSQSLGVISPDESEVRLSFAMLIPDNLYVPMQLWEEKFLELSTDWALGWISVFGNHGDGVFLQSYADGEFDSGFWALVSPDDEEGYRVDFESYDTFTERDLDASSYVR